MNGKWASSQLGSVSLQLSATSCPSCLLTHAALLHYHSDCEKFKRRPGRQLPPTSGTYFRGLVIEKKPSLYATAP